MSNDGNEETGTEAGTGLIRFVLQMIKCYIQFQILVAETGREISKKLTSPLQAGEDKMACITHTSSHTQEHTHTHTHTFPTTHLLKISHKYELHFILELISRLNFIS